MEMRFSVSVDEALLESAIKALNARSKADAIRMALEEAVRRRRLDKVLGRAGTVEFAGDAEEIVRLRGEG